MVDCAMTRNMPICAFVVFVGSFIIFLYTLKIDYDKTTISLRTKEETIWIFIFFIILLSCVIVSSTLIKHRYAMRILKRCLKSNKKRIKKYFK